jgi:putative transposase
MTDPGVPIAAQCELLNVSRATYYEDQQPKIIDLKELKLLALIDEEYTRHPFYGSRKMGPFLLTLGHLVNRKRVQRLMQTLGLSGMAPGPNTSRAHPKHKVYPYLLRGVQVDRPNQVWGTDITYIRLAAGFVYLVAVIDWYSRKVLSWRVSNTMHAAFCIVCLEEAIELYGVPDIFNSDQGAQFTSDAFIAVLLLHGITISMDGRGRAFDNIFVERLWRSLKHEDIYLKAYALLPDLLLGLIAYFSFYNDERPHQALDYQTPSSVYGSGQGGGAVIIDKYKILTAEGAA